MTVRVCVGSACYLKGAPEIAELFQKAVEENKLEKQVNVVGSFCLGTCSAEGVTVQIDEDIYTGVTVTDFTEFFAKNVLGKLEKECRCCELSGSEKIKLQKLL